MKLTVGVEHQIAVQRLGAGDQLYAQRVAVDIRVVCQKTFGDRHGNGFVPGNVVCIGLADGQVVNGIDDEIDRGEVRIVGAVGRSVSEGVGAVVVFVRRVGQRTVRVHGNRAMRRVAAHPGHRKRVILYVRVVSKDSICSIDGEQIVLVRAVGIGLANGQVVNGVDEEVDRGRVRKSEPSNAW